MEKHIPKRMCIACRQMKPKAELIRVVREIESGEVMLDKESKLFGRGAYVCRDEKCMALARKKKGFERHFKCPVSKNVYDECDSVLEE